MYEYVAKVLRVIDGDTVELDIDLGCNVHIHERCRLYGINAPETHGVKKDSDEYKAGIAATRYLDGLIGGREVRIKTIKDKKGKYGRYLVRIWHNGTDVNDVMIRAGHAVPYDGGPR